MVNANFRDIQGRRFGRLSVLERWSNTASGAARWRCACDCGRWSVVRSNELIQGKTTSCGCVARESARASGSAKRRHGKSTSGAEYTTWQTMKDRCYNPRSKAWARYGSRGISVCQLWRGDFSAFLRDVGPRPARGYTLDRIDNDGNYEPGNCRWATPQTQGNNRSTNRRIAYEGNDLTLTEWSRRTGIPANTLRWRLRRWSPEQAFTTPVAERRSSASPTRRAA